MGRITSISLSPSIDKYIEFDRFALGATNRVRHTHSDGSGKAINVALSAKALGIESECIGLLGEGGSSLIKRLDRVGVHHEFFNAPGEVRVNQKLFDRSTGITTEINESAPEAPQELLDEVMELAEKKAETSDILVFSGSLPQHCPVRWYADAIRAVHERNPECKCVLDAEGEKLTLGVAEKPWLVKPNRYELELWAGKKLTGVQDIVEAAQKLLEAGVENVVVSMGSEGAILVSEQGTWIGSMPVSQIETTVGAGDAMVAGLSYSALFSSDCGRMLACGLAAAAARIEYPTASHIDGEVFSKKLETAEVRRLVPNEFVNE